MVIVSSSSTGLSSLFFKQRSNGKILAIFFVIVSILSKPSLAIAENPVNINAQQVIRETSAISNIEGDLKALEEDNSQDELLVEALELIENNVLNEELSDADTELSLGVSSNDSEMSIQTLSEIEIVKGTNLLVPIAVAHLNRIETPFNKPRVRTNSEAIIEVEDNTLFILTYDSHPISLFIEETDFPDNRVSLTLIAKRIPPIDIRLVAGNDYVQNTYTDNAPTRLKSPKALTEIKQIFKTLTFNQLPEGFTVHKINTAIEYPECHHVSLVFSFDSGQLLRSTDKQIFVGKVTNNGLLDIELNEQNCQIDNQVATSFFPLTRLSPSQTTQIYLMTLR